MEFPYWQFAPKNLRSTLPTGAVNPPDWGAVLMLYGILMRIGWDIFAYGHVH